MKQPTLLQQKQRELSWLIYTACGAIRSMTTARANSNMLSLETHQELGVTIASLERLEGQLRSALNNLKEPL